MHKIDDRRELLERQYQSDANLNARLALHLGYSTGSEDWHTWLGRRIRIPDGARVLELGCGNAALWQRGRPALAGGARVLLTDLSPGMLAAARQALADEPGTFELLRSDAARVPCAAARFDVVIANHMLYHVPRPERALAEMARVLRPGGVLYMALNGVRHMRQIKAWCDRFLGAQGGFGDVPVTLESVAPLLAEHFEFALERFPDGLRVDAVEPVLDYVRSAISDEAAASAGFEALAAHLAAELETRGALEIDKDAALIVARSKPR